MPIEIKPATTAGENKARIESTPAKADDGRAWWYKTWCASTAR